LTNMIEESKDTLTIETLSEKTNFMELNYE